ncbi:MAG TPA: DNA starvation/stationary phase protection protein [Nitrosopumilaceae archaeon]|nr:DNA starvation/stationary phase protection protein [Nitrosopumilaceae archaeon]
MAQKIDKMLEQDVHIGLEENDREGVITLLTKLLADEYVLYTKTRNYHWNVISPHFNDYHKLFEGQYGEIEVFIDDIAERIRQLGGKAIATLTELKSHARLEEQPSVYPEDVQMVKNLVVDHEAIIRTLRGDLKKCDEGFHDMGTNDFLTGLMEKHEKMVWMLRSTVP